MEILQNSLDKLGIDFNIHASQQFATVIFDRIQDCPESEITIFRDGQIKQFYGNNNYNPSYRRHATCVYVQCESEPEDIIKICVIQHKGETIIDIKRVFQEEYNYLFS